MLVAHHRLPSPHLIPSPRLTSPTSSSFVLLVALRANRFRLHITSLDILSRYATHKVWIKPNGELPFLYGGHIVKAHLGRITDDTPEHAGVVVLSMSGVALGFGVTARSTVDTRKLDPTSIIVFHQADVGEYLRDEDTLF